MSVPASSRGRDAAYFLDPLIQNKKKKIIRAPNDPDLKKSTFLTEAPFPLPTGVVCLRASDVSKGVAA